MRVQNQLPAKRAGKSGVKAPTRTIDSLALLPAIAGALRAGPDAPASARHDGEHRHEKCIAVEDASRPPSQPPALTVFVAATMPPLELLPFAATAAGTVLATLGLALVTHDGVLVLLGLALCIATVALAFSALH